ncbi:hypothetical protein chiPu_0006103 [Chiloscyllium punctatum]|uniref:G-protein coupled receptors family 2 profile 2 domain-containing protein n=1 Tax=Chiloscyllium punctatum TaxID=137246 RepID=A0A401SBA2_CHIPU|nr:hypothetical protein [Chiloscyllium punctatum]
MCGTITRFAVWFCGLLVCNLDGARAKASSNSSIFPTSHYVYEYINTPLKWEHASRYCELRFGSLPVVSKVEDKNAILDLLATQGANQQVWINGKLSEVSGGEDLTVRKNSVDKFEILVFLNKTDTKHAKILNALPPLSAVTICARVQWDNQSSDIATVFSYAIPVFINEFQLRGRIDDAGIIQLALIVHGHHTPYKSVLKSDGLWHHICVTWQKENGVWFIYADGIKVSSGDDCYSSQIIGGNGTFIIGQDQDSLGGTFKQNEAFSGNITFLNIWTHALDANQISAVSMCSFPQQNLFYQWNLTSLEIEPSVQVVELQLNCTGLKISSGKCQTFDAASGFKSQFGCENLLPFLCQLTKDTYLKLNEFQSDSRSLFKIKSEAISHDTMVIEYMSLSNAKLVPNISEAETILKTVQHVLSIENVTLQPADMLSVIRLLQNIANVKPHVNDTQEALENVSRSFIHIAGELLDQHNAERWTEINEIVQGPMAVVYGVDRLMENLNKLLSSDQENIVIRSKNIKLEITQKILTNFTNDIDVYMSLTRATFVNTWYGTLHHLLGNGTLDTNSVMEAVSDEGFKGAGMQVASAVISSTVFQGGQPISMATKYRLRHRIKAFSSLAVDSVCVFWNFSLRPEKGGSWSTAGCRVIESGLESTACFCNHTTNFALLFQLYEVKRSSYEEAVLMNLTLIGCTISLCALVVTLVLFSVVGVPKSDRTTVHKNLICALVAAEGLLVARFPVFIVAITLATTGDKYIADNHCWLNIQSEIIWAFVGPVLFTLTINTFVLLRVVMITITSSQRHSMMLASDSSLAQRALCRIWTAIKPVVILLPVLGLTWFCGVLVHFNIVLAYIFVALNSFQGLYIFLVYGVYNSEVRNAIKRMKEKRKALSFTNCTSSRPSSCLTSPKMTTSLNVGKCSVSAPDKDTLKSTTNKSASSKGASMIFNRENGAEDVMWISESLVLDKTEIQLTAFRVSGMSNHIAFLL